MTQVIHTKIRDAETCLWMNYRAFASFTHSYYAQKNCNIREDSRHRRALASAADKLSAPV